MSSLSVRVNGQPDYRPANQARAAWREEMLDNLLSQMRHRQMTEPALAPPVQEAAGPGKGLYVDIYV